MKALKSAGVLRGVAKALGSMPYELGSRGSPAIPTRRVYERSVVPKLLTEVVGGGLGILGGMALADMLGTAGVLSGPGMEGLLSGSTSDMMKHTLAAVGGGVGSSVLLAGSSLPMYYKGVQDRLYYENLYRRGLTNFPRLAPMRRS